MKIIEYASKANAYIAEMKAKGKKIGFVPTLGGLHKGHQSLMQKAHQENEITLISIFLNPMQFRKKQYLEYPSDFEQDKVLAQQIDMIFHPDVTEMFQSVNNEDDFFRFQNDECQGRLAEDFLIEEKNGIDNLIRVPSTLVHQLDGKLHPWVFDGAATIVSRLFKILQPDNAYFGEKDIQQLAILQKMAKTYFPDIKVIGVPTLREADGLAFSSRNALLTDEQRQSALTVCRAFRHGENLIKKGELSAPTVLNAIKERIKTPVKIDYIDIVDKKSLKPVHQIRDTIILYVAFFLNHIRLTDTLIVD